MDTINIEQPQNLKARSILYYIFMAVVMLFAVVSLFFIAIDAAAIKMSLDPGFTIFFVLVLLVFISKLLCLFDFFIILFVDSSSVLANKIISYAIQGCGSLFVGASLVIIVVEIYILTNSIAAVLIHPFVIDFFLFMICNIMSYLVIGSTSVTMTEYVYVALPQKAATPQPKEVEMATIASDDESKKDEPVKPVETKVPIAPETPIKPMETKKAEAPKQVPSQPMNPRREVPAFPQLPVHIPMQFMHNVQPMMQVPVQMPMIQQFPEMPMQFMQQPTPFQMMPSEEMQFVNMPQYMPRPNEMPIQPTPPPMQERPKAMRFVPYYMPQ